MDFFLALGLINVLGCIVWIGAAIVHSLILLTIARRGDDDSSLRAADETAVLDRHAIRPAMLVTILSTGILAWASGLAGEAWVILGAGLTLAAWAWGCCAVEPACGLALQMPKGNAPFQARHALRLARVGLGLQGAAMAALLLTPGWSEAAIMAGLLTCMALAAALVITPEGASEQPA